MALLDEFQDSLDRAIACAAGAEFDRLREGLEAETVAGHIHTAMEELRKLQRGYDLVMPDYHNPWVVPFYTSWYQPKQAHLAYTLIRKIIGRQNGKLAHNTAGNLCVVDFGCGASATRFGLTLAVAESIQKGQAIGRVEVYGVDVSQPMVDMGESLWAVWGEEITEGVLKTAYDKVNAVNTAELLDWRPPEASIADSDVWLVALHTAYPINSGEVRELLSLMAAMLNPRAFFATSHPANWLSVRAISPFDDAEPVVPVLRLDAECLETTEWRQELGSEYVEYLQGDDYGYLDNWVSYNFNYNKFNDPPYCLLHII